MSNPLRILLLSIFLAIPPIHAWAQIGLRNPAIDTVEQTPQYTRADIESINRVVGFTPEQSAIVLDIYEAHVRRFTTEVQELIFEIEDARDEALATNNPAPLTDADDKISRWNAKAKEYDQQFLSDLRLLLSKDQEAMWPSVERELRRIRLTPRGVFAGESVDLVRILENAHPEWVQDPQIKAIVDSYVNAIDAALTDRDLVRERSRPDLTRGESQADRNRVRRAMEDIRRARIRVRTVNEEHLRRLLVALPPHTHPRIERAFYESAVGERRATTPLGSRIRAATTLPDLTPDQAAAVQAANDQLDAAILDFLKDDYRAHVQLQNEQFPIATQRYLDGEPAYIAMDDFINLPDDNPAHAVMQRRFQFERDIYKHLRPLLTRHQRSQLPSYQDTSIWFWWPVPDFN